MGKTRIIGFNAKQLEKELWEQASKEQTARLIEYAKEKIISLGDSISSYHSRHNLDRTGNLLDSLCWGVSFDGKLAEGGFYRPKTASGLSHLHEWSAASFLIKVGKDEIEHTQKEFGDEVDGHALAEEYIEKMGNDGAMSGGWKVFFAILAPYWGYWEKGFTLYPHFARSETLFMQRKQFAVMTMLKDSVQSELKPAKTTISVRVPTYTSLSLYKKAKKVFEGK